MQSIIFWFYLYYDISILDMNITIRDPVLGLAYG